jgi:hypothetical protein
MTPTDVLEAAKSAHSKQMAVVCDGADECQDLLHRLLQLDDTRHLLRHSYETMSCTLRAGTVIVRFVCLADIRDRSALDKQRFSVILVSHTVRDITRELLLQLFPRECRWVGARSVDYPLSQPGAAQCTAPV